MRPVRTRMPPTSPHARSHCDRRAPGSSSRNLRLQLDSASSDPNQFVPHCLRSSEQGHAQGALLSACAEEMFSGRSARVEEVEIFLGETTLVEQSHEGLHGQTRAHIWFDQTLVAHEETPEGLQDGNFQRKVEWRNHAGLALGPPHPLAVLAIMVPRLTEPTVGQHAYTIPTEVFDEAAGDLELPLGLSLGLGRGPHDHLHEVVEHCLVLQQQGHLGHHVPEHAIPVYILLGVVQTTFGNRPLGGNKIV